MNSCPSSKSVVSAVVAVSAVSAGVGAKEEGSSVTFSLRVPMIRLNSDEVVSVGAGDAVVDVVLELLGGSSLGGNNSSKKEISVPGNGTAEVESGVELSLGVFVSDVPAVQEYVIEDVSIFLSFLWALFRCLERSM